MLPTVNATRYVLPLREGGSLPAIVEADNLGLYVVKFRGAGQGVSTLVAEVVAGEIGRALGLNVPDLALVHIDPILGRNDPDAEIRFLLKQSAGLNLGLDYLPGSTMFDPAADAPVDPLIASLGVWFDAFVQNVDRTPRNANLLRWHRQLYFIDHGAALYFHHDWPTMPQKAASPFPAISDHVLLPWATQLPQAGQIGRERITAPLLQSILNLVPDEWLLPEPEAETPAAKREAYVAYFLERLQQAHHFEAKAEQEAAHASII